MLKYDLSVVIPVYNPDRDELFRAVKSVLNQPSINVQVIAVNDGWPDDAIFTELYLVDGVDVHVLNHTKNKGVTQAWNTGFEYAIGEWCMMLGSDDWVEPLSLTKIVKGLQKLYDPRNYYGYGQTQYIDDGRVHDPPEWCEGINNIDFNTRYACVWHRSWFGQCRFWKPDDLPYYYEDWDFILQLERAGVKGHKFDHVVLNRVNKPDSLSGKALPYQQRILETLRERNS